MGKISQMPMRGTKQLEETFDDAANALEVIANLNHLVCEEAHDPAAVRSYVDESQKAVSKLARSLQTLASARQQLESAA